MGKYQYVLFDMDGTLVESGKGIIESVRYTAETLGLAKEDDDSLLCFVGPPLLETFIGHYGVDEESARQACLVFREYYSHTGMFSASLYSGIEELLNELSGDYDLFIATSKPTVYTRKIADALGIGRYFRGIVGSNLDNTRSRKSEVISALLAEYKIADPATAVMVGDKAQDVIGAGECGIETIGVTYGYGSIQELTEAGAKTIVNAPKAVGEYLRSTENQ